MTYVLSSDYQSKTVTAHATDGSRTLGPFRCQSDAKAAVEEVGGTVEVAAAMSERQARKEQAEQRREWGKSRSLGGRFS